MKKPKTKVPIKRTRKSREDATFSSPEPTVNPDYRPGPGGLFKVPQIPKYDRPGFLPPTDTPLTWDGPSAVGVREKTK